MSQDTFNELDQLREQLDSVQRTAEQTKAHLILRLRKSLENERLYRGICWGFIAMTVVGALFELLQR